MVAKHLALGLAFAGALSLAACGSARPVADAGAGASACTLCHGDAARAEDVVLNQAAPPVGVSSPGGGAHLAHLHAGAFGSGVACADCHAVPDVASHADGVVTITFSPLAGPGASWNPASGTCSGVYCHGATLSGGPAASPPWASTAGLDCTSCHGAPPPNHAPTSTDCSSCHPGTVLADGSIDVANGLHVNGTIDVDNAHAPGWASPDQHGYTANRAGLAGCRTCHGTDLTGGSAGVSCSTCHATAGFPSWATSCTFCHGNRTSGRQSPPVDTQGRSATSNVSVGVHDSHVGTTIAAPLGCGECHESRGSVVTDAAHVDGDARAEVVFGALARTGGASPVYARASGTSATCASTYCHGSFSGGANATPSWTSTAQVTCSSCHGNPPGTGDHSKHTGGFQCLECHGHNGSGASHVNGTRNTQFQVSGASYNPATRSCGTFNCHGEQHSGRTW